MLSNLTQLEIRLGGTLHFPPELLHHLEECLALLLTLYPPDKPCSEVNPALCQVVDNDKTAGELLQLGVVRGKIPGRGRGEKPCWVPGRSSRSNTSQESGPIREDMFSLAMAAP